LLRGSKPAIARMAAQQTIEFAFKGEPT